MIGRTIIAGAAVALAAASPVLANQQGSTACAGWAVTFTGYPSQPLTFDVDDVVDGTVTTTRLRVDGPTAYVPTERQLADGPHRIELYVTRVGLGFGRRVLVASADVTCGPPPTPPPPPVEPPVVVVPPPTAPPAPPIQRRRVEPLPPVVKPPRRVRPLPRPTVCRVYGLKRPARSVLGVPRPGQFRVRPDGVTGRWTGFRGDRFTHTRTGRVVFVPGTWCGRHRTVAVTG